MRRLILTLGVFVLLLAGLVNLDVLRDLRGHAPEAGAFDYGKAFLHTAVWVAGACAVVAALDVFFWDWFVARLIRRPVPRLLKSALALAIALVAITGIVGVVFERDVTGIWATSSALGVVFGFAMRSTLQDLFTGIAMNVDGSLKAGDWIQLHGNQAAGVHYGQVLEIAWRTTHIKLENNNIMIVPNSVMGAMPVTNFAHAGHTSRLQTEIVIDFDVPPERARRILLAGTRAAAAARIILAEPAPDVMVGEPNERGVTYRIRFWGKVSERSPTAMQDAVMTELLHHLRVAGLTPAYPKEDMFVARRPKRLLDHASVQDRVEVLSRTEFFGRTLDADELLRLAEAVEPQVFPAGLALVSQGEPGASMFVVVEGCLDVQVQRPEAARPIRVNQVMAGQIFGEMSLLTQEPRSASVIAATDVVAYEITQAIFETLLFARPALAEQVSDIVARHRVRTDAALRETAGEDVERETRRLKEQIMARMKGVFLSLVGVIPVGRVGLGA